MIPSCISLNQQQIDKFDKFVKQIQTTHEKELEQNLEETSNINSPFVFHIHDTGINTSIIVTSFDQACQLSLDDEGEILS